jgi:hypothetical protein
MTDSEFNPKISKDEALALARKYAAEEDEAAFEAGRNIRNGQYSRANLVVIFKWKTRDRGKTRLENNSDQEIEEALRLASHATQPRSAIAILTGLSGVAVPVASAIMTTVHPERYTIIDFRALETLGLLVNGACR